MDMRASLVRTWNKHSIEGQWLELLPTGSW
jgi:hypothetical protein